MMRISGSWSGAKADECVEEGFNTREGWTQAHTMQEEEAQMSPDERQVAGNVKADELAKTGAMKDGAEVPERIAKDALVCVANPFCSHLSRRG